MADVLHVIAAPEKCRASSFLAGLKPCSYGPRTHRSHRCGLGRDVLPSAEAPAGTGIGPFGRSYDEWLPRVGSPSGAAWPLEITARRPDAHLQHTAAFDSGSPRQPFAPAPSGDAKLGTSNALPAGALRETGWTVSHHELALALVHDQISQGLPDRCDIGGFEHRVRALPLSCRLNKKQEPPSVSKWHQEARLTTAIAEPVTWLCCSGICKLAVLAVEVTSGPPWWLGREEDVPLLT